MPDKKTNEKKITISASVKDKIDKMATMPSNLGIPGNHRPFTQEEKDVMFYALIEKKLTKRAIIRAGLFERGKSKIEELAKIVEEETYGPEV